MSLIGVPRALRSRPWARLRARKEGASFIVVSKSCRCSGVRGCTYLTIITSSACTTGAMKNGSALMRYKIGIVSKNFWSSTYLCRRECDQWLRLLHCLAYGGGAKGGDERRHVLRTDGRGRYDE